MSRVISQGPDELAGFEEGFFCDGTFGADFFTEPVLLLKPIGATSYVRTRGESFKRRER
jgi:hypothetical protein